MNLGFLGKGNSSSPEPLHEQIAAIAIPFAYSMQYFVRLNRGLAAATGFVSVAFGMFLCFQIGFVEGLFTDHPGRIQR